MANLELTSRYFREIFEERGTVLWRGRTLKHPDQPLDPARPSKQALLASRGALISYELRQLRVTSALRRALACYLSRRRTSGAAGATPLGGVYGMLCDLIWFDDPAVARAVALRRWMAMETLIVDSNRTAQDFRMLSGSRGPLSFFHAAPSARPPSSPADPRAETAALLTGEPGCLGLAADLARMAHEHEAVLRPALASLLRHLVLFRTSAHARAALARLRQLGAPRAVPTWASLDHACDRGEMDPAVSRGGLLLCAEPLAQVDTRVSRTMGTDPGEAVAVLERRQARIRAAMRACGRRRHFTLLG